MRLGPSITRRACLHARSTVANIGRIYNLEEQVEDVESVYMHDIDRLRRTGVSSQAARRSHLSFLTARSSPPKMIRWVVRYT